MTTSSHDPIVFDLLSGTVNVVSERSPLSALLKRSVMVIDPDASLAEAARRMGEEGVSLLLIEDLGAVVTEHDIVRAAGRGVPMDEPVSIMGTEPALVVPGAMTVLAAGALLLNQQLGHLLVDLDGELSVVSMSDITAVLLQSANPQLWLASLQVALESHSEAWLG